MGGSIVRLTAVLLLLRSCYLGYHLMCKAPVQEKEEPIVKTEISIDSSNTTNKPNTVKTVDFVRKQVTKKPYVPPLEPVDK